MPPDDRRLEHFSVKEAVMPFGRFPGADTVLGPEMKSTGEVMGIARNFPAAFAKTQLAISYALPEGGTVFVSVCDRDKRAIVPIARDIARLGFQLVATGGTARALRAAGVECEQVRKIHEGEGNVRDMIAAGDIALMINTPFGHATRADGYELRLEAVKHGVTHVTNLAGAWWPAWRWPASAVSRPWPCRTCPNGGKVVVEMNGGRDPETCPLHLAPMFLS